MRFARVEDSLDWSEVPPRREPVRVVMQADVEQEARRRKQGLAIDEWQLREFVSGVPLPDRLVQLCRQIDLASAALSRMSPIPTNFADDIYWPRMW
ncbi:hypothetical protein [Devosia aurantiaca]|uniref:Uncharacterized protein n=1 Tax=Devosia aurantiaca TaxID=2714858 RepID=A0A6M1SK27_9HYPH|nr:hypothetical protein [Devosia aurantiaca]NGP17578.1 hypothetical protein [Devosia aurantiaca]